MRDVVVQADRPEAVFQSPKLERAMIARQRKRLGRFGVNERQDRTESGTEHRLPPHQAVKVVGGHPVLPVPPASGVLPALSLHLHHQVGRESRIQQEVGVFHPLFAENGAAGLVDRHAGDAQSPNVRLKRGLVMVGPKRHRRRLSLHNPGEFQSRTAAGNRLPTPRSALPIIHDSAPASTAQDRNGGEAPRRSSRPAGPKTARRTAGAWAAGSPRRIPRFARASRTPG